MTVHELMLELVKFAQKYGDDAHVTIYDDELKMPAIVKSLKGNAHSVQLLTVPLDISLPTEYS